MNSGAAGWGGRGRISGGVLSGRQGLRLGRRCHSSVAAARGGLAKRTAAA